MNAISKRNLKSKSKTVSKTVTLKEMLSKKDRNTASTSNTSENQNESFIDVFKFNAVKDKKHQTQSQFKEDKSKSDDAFDELFSDFKIKTETSKEDSASKSDDSVDELFSDFSRKAATSSDENKSTVDYEEKDFTEILRDNLSTRCPICFRKNSYDGEAAYIGHLKKCAYTNKMTMEQLKKALELQHKQASERVALGLPIAPKERPQRKYQNKGPMDSNMQLGIALSNSLREFDYMNVIQEKEALVQAGIEPETLSQYRNLEDFGFASNKPAENTNFRGYKRNRNPAPRNTVLFTRTQEERERIITEKVAILLIDGCTETIPNETISEPFILKSNYLKQHLDDETTFWKRSHQMEENITDLYYVETLSNFITPCEVDTGANLRHVSQIPCRPPSPPKPTILRTIEPVSWVPPSPETLTTIKTVTKKLKRTPTPVIKDSQLRQDWRYMLNKDILSDLTIYVKNEVPIYAHKLVFYARCRSILTETIEEIENNKRNEILMWMEYSFEAVMALLEYIYAGSLPDLTKLADPDKKDLRALSDRYSFKDVIDALNGSEEAQMFSCDEDESSSPSKNHKVPVVELTMLSYKSASPVKNDLATPHKKDLVEESEIISDNDSSPKNIAADVTEGEKNLQMMLESMKTQNLRSPELFEDDSDTVAEETSEARKSQSQLFIEEVLSRLCSPVRSPSSPKKPDTNLNESIISEVDLTEEFNSDKKIVEKRKSFSPLEKSRVKKTKTSSEKKKRRTPRKLPLSQVCSLSDASEISDSDESLYKAKKATSDHSDLNNSVLSIEHKDPPSSNSQSTHNISGIDEIPRRESESSTTSKTSHVLNDEPCQDINPVWEGFEDFNSMPCDYDYFPEPVHNSSHVSERGLGLSSPRKSKSPAIKFATDSLFDSPLVALSSPCQSKTPVRKSITDSLFGSSFTVSEDILSKIETAAFAVASQKPPASSTPDSVRKFQRRSRSENSITPANKCSWNNVTPMADYSAMKNEELKKELEKYGIKPGLSRNKAKMMLKYIYEELHPFEDKIDEVPQKTNDPATRKDPEKNSNHDANSNDSSDTDTSGVSVLEETYVEETPEICTQDPGNAKTKVDLNTGFTNLLRCDKSLQRQILLYEPIWLEPLKSTLKESGVKCTLNELMNYLDEKCITFRSQQQRGRQKKKKSTEDEKPKKKRKNKDAIDFADL